MIRNSQPFSLIALAFACVGLVAPQAFAKELAASATDGVEIDRDIRALSDELRPRDLDRDYADTALVFSNLGGEATKVLCVVFNGNGRLVGRAWLRLPALGVRYMLASDLANGVDLVGHAQCAAEGTVEGTAIFLGPGLTDLPAKQVEGAFGRIRFPLVATY
jgi:hypothetical protein